MKNYSKIPRLNARHLTNFATEFVILAKNLHFYEVIRGSENGFPHKGNIFVVNKMRL